MSLGSIWSVVEDVGVLKFSLDVRQGLVSLETSARVPSENPASAVYLVSMMLSAVESSSRSVSCVSAASMVLSAVGLDVLPWRSYLSSLT